MSYMSPIRQTLIISLIAVLLSFTLSASAYLLIFGMDERFWRAMAIAIIVPWGVTIPLCFFASKQRFKLSNLTDRLQDTQLKLREANTALEHRASYDGMTGLLNRDSFISRFDEMRKQHGANILMLIDVDHFKYINDNYGHPVGDEALMLLGRVFRKVLRQDDLVGRIGGEEFGIFLPDTSVPEGQIIAEMIRHEIENTVFKPHDNMHHVITVSIGIADIAPHQERSVLMTNADTALFTAKRCGRNQVALFEPSMRIKPLPVHVEAKNMECAILGANFG